MMNNISCHLVVHNDLGNVQTYSDGIELLYQFDYLDEGFKTKLVGMTGLRNISVHEYVAVDIGQLYGMFDYLNDFNSLIQAVKKHFS